MSVLSVDGGGVFPDTPLHGTRLRVHLTDDPAHDLTVYVEDGRLHVAGQYARLHVRQDEPHRVSVETVAP